MNCGFRDFMQIYKSYYTISLFITSNTKVGIDLRNPFGLKEMLDSAGGNSGWRHLALTRTREYDITDSNCAYTPENKKGFVIKYGVYVKNVGYPYVRDPSKDENGLYAFTWTSGGLKDNNTSPTLNDNPLPTIWLNTSSPSETTTGYIDVQQTDSVDVSKLNPYYAEYRDEINIPLKCLNTDDPGCVANWHGTKYSGNISDANGNNCSVFKNDASKAVFGYIYENGTLINILATKYGSSWAPTATDGDKLKLKLNATTSTSEQVFDGIDDLCIYDRFLSTSELK
jgi:hypothetical protein